MRLAGTRFANAFALFCCLLFVFLGCIWINQIGLQADESLFSASIYPPFVKHFAMRAFQRDVPLMVMSYVGTLKGLLWAAIFAMWQPSAASTRIPAVFIAAITIWLFYRLLLRTLGTLAALVGCALLATDTSFLLTSRWDWGPVVLQHFCLVASMFCLVRFHQERRRMWLGLGFFTLGLGMWDKAIFIWMLAGLGLATILVFGRCVRRCLTPPNIAIATLTFLLGALPLVIYNVRHPLVTFRGNAAWSLEGLPYKASLLKGTLEGTSLFGAITHEEWNGPARKPETVGEKLLIAFNEAVGHPRKNLLLYGLAFSLLLLPLVWKTPARSAALFTLIFSFVTFVLMASNPGTGTGAHHTVLLWPMPHILLAAVLAEVSRRRRWATLGLSLVVGGLCISNLLLTTTYYTNMIQMGGTLGWSDAIYALSDTLAVRKPARVCLLDWGFVDNLRLLHKGQLHLAMGDDPVTDKARRYARLQMAERGNLFVAHSSGSQPFTELSKHFIAFAEQEGYRKQDLEIIPDSNGRNIIEIFRLVKTDTDLH